jgi:hypothetical protein
VGELGTGPSRGVGEVCAGGGPALEGVGVPESSAGGRPSRPRVPVQPGTTDGLSPTPSTLQKATWRPAASDRPLARAIAPEPPNDIHGANAGDYTCTLLTSPPPADFRTAARHREELSSDVPLSGFP